MNPLFSGIIMNRNAGSVCFKDEVTNFVEGLLKRVHCMKGFDNNVRAIMVDLVLNAKFGSIRPMPFFYLCFIGSYLVFALPQLNHVFHNATLVRNTSKKEENQMLIVDRRGPRKNLVRAPDGFSDFHLESSEFAVYPSDVSMLIFATWNYRQSISVAPVSNATGGAYAAFSFHFGEDKQLISCQPPKLRLQQFITLAQCILRENLHYPNQLSDTTLSLGVSHSELEVVGVCCELIV